MANKIEAANGLECVRPILDPIRLDFVRAWQAKSCVARLCPIILSIRINSLSMSKENCLLLYLDWLSRNRVHLRNFVVTNDILVQLTLISPKMHFDESPILPQKPIFLHREMHFSSHFPTKIDMHIFLNMFGTCLERVPNMFGTSSERVRVVSGPCLEHVQNMFGPCSEHVQDMFGSCLEHDLNVF